LYLLITNIVVVVYSFQARVIYYNAF